MSSPKHEKSASLKWLENTTETSFGTTFSVPWKSGALKPETAKFLCFGAGGAQVQAQSWILAYWHAGSIKWTAHAIAACSTPHSSYMMEAVVGSGVSVERQQEVPSTAMLTVVENPSKGYILVKTGKVDVCFPMCGTSLVRSITSTSGRVTAENGRLVLLSQSNSPSDLPEPSGECIFFEGKVE